MQIFCICESSTKQNSRFLLGLFASEREDSKATLMANLYKALRWNVKFLAPNRSDKIRMTQNVLNEIEEYCRVPQIYQGFGSINRPWHTWEVFIECDCTMLEINPLASLTDGRVLVCDSKVPRCDKWDRLLTRQPRRKTWGEVMEGCNRSEGVVE